MSELGPSAVISVMSPRRPAWVEINRGQLRRNLGLIRRDMPAGLGLLSVVKDDAYGHGMEVMARVALEAGARMLAVTNLDEALQLRSLGLAVPILLFGERTAEEIPWCVRHGFSGSVSSSGALSDWRREAIRQQRSALIQLEVDTGMSRYGVRWNEAQSLAGEVAASDELELEGVWTHFAMSDELDKTFALIQLGRYEEVLGQLEAKGIPSGLRHTCNSGGYLDLAAAHFDLVRLGILPTGVYPSAVCRRIPGLLPVLSVKCLVAAVRWIEKGDTVGYGMRYRAEARRRIAVLPLGYGDGYPRVRNRGYVLLCGGRAPVVGGNAMDAMMVDVTDLPAADVGSEVVVMGSQGEEVISAHDLAQWKGTVSYEVLCAWRARLPRVCVGDES
jgi:alanine racemase